MGNKFYDVIVIGSGMTGAFAAKEFCDKGFKTLILERGPNVKHIVDYPTMNNFPYELPHRNKITYETKNNNPIASSNHAFTEDKVHFFVKDHEHPYIQDKPFSWIRGYQTGGRSLMWGRMVQRWSDFDFEGPSRDGFAIDWPIRYNDLKDWYSYVEKFMGVSGNLDNLDVLPDGEFLPPMELTAVEKYFQNYLLDNYINRNLIIGRCAHITGNFEFYAKQGRGGCQFRDLCRRGCPFGGYFSSNSSTIPWAMKTGNLTLLNNAVVKEIVYDSITGKATGVRVIDRLNFEETIFHSKIIFLNAGSLNSLIILLNSRSERFPRGLGNDSGNLGKFIGFHNYRGRVTAEYHGMQNFKTKGRRPTNAYMPRFRNVLKQETSFLRGYAVSFRGFRSYEFDKESVGLELKENLLNPVYGPWRISASMMGETIPKASNFVRLDSDLRDVWGIPLLRISVDYDENDELMITDFHNEFRKMFVNAGFENVKVFDDHKTPGLDIHEMGGARMGTDPSDSVLNKWNQVHSCKNVFVTDGSCMVSTSTQNPSLTYLALTARAADFATKKLLADEL